VTQSKEKRREKGEGVADKGVELATKDDGGGCLWRVENEIA